MSKTIENTLAECGQEHVLKELRKRNPGDFAAFLEPLEETPLPWLLDAIEQMATDEKPKEAPSIEPPSAVDGSLENSPESQEARAFGDRLLAEGKIAILLVAGGMGTRLGWEGPKGTFPVGPVTKRSLFEVFAGQVRSLGSRAQRNILWAIQTSDANHEETKLFFHENDWFGLDPAQVQLFSQGTLPALRDDGRVAMLPSGDIACLPDGHGGVYRALEKKGILNWFEDAGIEHVYYFQVDNPLSILADSAFMGHHALRKSEMSTVVIKKRSPDERVGVLAFERGKLRVIEYSEIDADLASQQDPDGQLTLRAGNTGIHAFRLQFLKSMAAKGALPMHVARKPVPWYNEDPVPGFKLEYFVFDALSQAGNPLVYEVPREGYFAPVKNATGQDSPETAKKALFRLHRKQLRDVGCPISEDREVEISPETAGDPSKLKAAYRDGNDPLVI